MNETRLQRLALTRRNAVALMTGSAIGAVIGGPAFAQGKPKRGGTLRVSAFTNPSSLDPATGGAGSDHTFLYTLYDTLTEFDFETLKPKPGLAESWSFPDPNTLVLKIRAGVTFHDGTPLDAEAVKFNLERAKTDPKSNIKADVASIATVEASGPLEVTLKLSNPDTALPAILSDRAGMMVSPKAVKAAEGAGLNRSPVGAGAYTFVSWADGDRIVVKRNEKYWKPNRPYLDGIEFAIIPELTTGVRSVSAGQNDLIYQLPPRQKPIVERNPKLRVVTGPTVYIIQVYFNWGKPPFDNVKVRQAFNFAVDRASFLKAALAGIGEPAFMNLPKAHWAFDQSVAGLYPYNPGKAKQLLAEAGFKDGVTLEIGGYPDQDSVQRQEILIEQLRKAGFTVRFNNAPVAESSAAFFGAEKRANGLLSAWTGRPDPSQTYSLMYSKDAYFNAGRAPVPPELEAALKESRASADIAERTKAFAKVQRIVMENALVCPLAVAYELVAMNKKVQGYKPNLLGKPKYDDVWIDA